MCLIIRKGFLVKDIIVSVSTSQLEGDLVVVVETSALSSVLSATSILDLLNFNLSDILWLSYSDAPDNHQEHWACIFDHYVI